MSTNKILIISSVVLAVAAVAITVKKKADYKKQIKP